MEPISWETLQALARARGLNAMGVADTDLSRQTAVLDRWLAAGCHGDMDYMLRHRDLRADPAQLLPGCIRVITVRLDYLDPGTRPAAHDGSHIDNIDADGAASSDTANPVTDWRNAAWRDIHDPSIGTISLYARGRDYHKVLRQRLQGLAEDIQARIGPFGHRVFTDSGPVMEVALAAKSGLGWVGKHTLLLNREAGSMFFLGELLTDHPFETTPATTAHCGQCSACVDVCPTQAIRDGWVDARRCISYLTIEHKGAIPAEFRPAIGNRIYGCDDCQLICPWNKFAQPSALPDFSRRKDLEPQPLTTFLAWDEATFLKKTEGTAIRRIGHERWQRNVAVAMGNLPPATPQATEALQTLAAAREKASDLVREHIDWAMNRLTAVKTPA